MDGVNIGTVSSWYAVYTASRAEKKIKERFDQAGIKNYLPLKTEIRIWSDRKKKVVSPIVAGYIFVYVSPRQFLDVLNTPGVITFVKEKGTAVVIPDNQMSRLQLMVEHSVDAVEFTTEKINVGDKVRVKLGECNDLYGELVEYRGKFKIAIRLNYFGCALTTVPLSFVEKIKNDA